MGFTGAGKKGKHAAAAGEQVKDGAEENINKRPTVQV